MRDSMRSGFDVSRDNCEKGIPIWQITTTRTCGSSRMLSGAVNAVRNWTQRRRSLALLLGINLRKVLRLSSAPHLGRPAEFSEICHYPCRVGGRARECDFSPFEHGGVFWALRTAGNGTIAITVF
jgi:hypothetical protein